MKSIVLLAIILLLSACSYNQAPAPLGRAGEGNVPATQYGSASVETYAIEKPSHEIQTLEYEEPLQAEAVPAPQSQNQAVVALVDSAQQQSDQGKYNIAASKLERAVRIAPRDGQVWHELAKIRYEQSKFELAISLAKKSNLLAKSDLGLQRNNWLLMANCYEELGKPDSARTARDNATG